ncbi:MAG: sulfatase-like hydrolase/transferase [Proteobacteria bacterium]|nr:sulfatase-like hydrolase/transferase [Pseudomonadota bacterium]
MLVIMVIADSLKADAPSYAGGGASTPFLDQLAAEGTRFDDAFASGAWTIPSLLSMVTGKYGHRLGVGQWRHPFPRHQPTLMTAFSAAGFEVSCFHPYPRWGFHIIPGSGNIANSQDSNQIISFLKGSKGRDRFALIHHWWTHLPYINSELPIASWHKACDFALDSLGRYPMRIAPTLEESYFKSVSFFSESLLSRYLDAAGSSGEDVLLIVTSDHGETWGRSLPKGRRVSHVYDLHGRWLTDETIRIPLLFWGKGNSRSIPAGQKLKGFARGVDIGPTVAALADIPWPGPVPESEGPFLFNCGIDPEKLDSDIDGKSLLHNVMHGTDTSLNSAMTVSSHNTRVPRTYPEDGRKMWRTLGMRTNHHWLIWDGIETTRKIIPIEKGIKLSPKRADDEFETLETAWRAAVDSGPVIQKELFPKTKTNEPDEEEIADNRLRTLGYLD